jgi:hypothetical protein
MVILSRKILTSSLALALLILPGCTELGEGLSKAVVIEFDQSLNFSEYQFEQPIWVPAPSQTYWDKIVIKDETNNVSKKGVWILYQVCSIQNDAPKAQQFNYDVSKFYVDYGGKKHYYRPLAAYTYAGAGVPGIPVVTEVLAPQFRMETQTGPDQQGIPANPTNTLSVSWRFVIYVSTDLGDQTDLLTLNLPLNYDGTPIVMDNRNNYTVPNEGTVHKSDLPTACRPPKQ